MKAQVYIRRASTKQDIDSFRQLVTEFHHFLNEDLTFQNIEEELANLPGHFAAPGGVILLASTDGAQDDAGCVALRSVLHERMEGRACVMKRLYVRPAHQGKGIGRLLVHEAVRVARELGYEAIIFDTLQRLAASNRLYAKLGFQPCEPFDEGNPLQGIVYLRMQLR